MSVTDGSRFPRQRFRLSEIFHGELARRTIAISVVSAMTFGAQVTITVFMPTDLVSRGFDVASSLACTTVSNIGGLIGAILASAFGYRFRRRAIAVRFGPETQGPSLEDVSEGSDGPSDALAPGRARCMRRIQRGRHTHEAPSVKAPRRR